MNRNFPLIAALILFALALFLLAGCQEIPANEDNARAVVARIESNGSARIAVCVGPDGKTFKVLSQRASLGHTCPNGKRFQ